MAVYTTPYKAFPTSDTSTLKLTIYRNKIYGQCPISDAINDFWINKYNLDPYCAEILIEDIHYTVRPGLFLYQSGRVVIEMHGDNINLRDLEKFILINIETDR